ncbi:hypothetical protein CLAFUW7_06944 [Fulvia fulva]|nr:hypothetical protein CLAFUW7_06944 [Fulvia fulva]
MSVNKGKGKGKGKEKAKPTNPLVPSEPGYVQDSKGDWHQFAHPSNNFSREQFPTLTTKHIAAKKPESMFRYIWRRYITDEAQYSQGTWDDEDLALQNALYKRHQGLKKAERDYKKYEKKMLKNKHIHYIPESERPSRHDYSDEEDGGDGYRAPQDPQDAGEGPSNRGESVPPPYPLEEAGFTGEKVTPEITEVQETQEERAKKNRRHATLHALEAASGGLDTGGHRERDEEMERREVRDDAPVIPRGW